MVFLNKKSLTCFRVFVSASQTFAFLDSLSRMVTGVGTVWIIGKFEDPLIHDGYRLSVQCFNRRHRGISTSAAASASTFRVEFVNDDHQLRDERGNVVRRDGGSDVWSQTLGQTLVDTLRSRIRVDHVMVAVDEMIWIRPVDLRRAVKVMSHCDSGQVSKHDRV